jgi:PAS domain S-box-containing protein
VNREACDSLGYTRDELVGMSPGVRRGETGFYTIVSHLDSGDVVTFDSRHRRKDGSTFAVEVRLRSFTQEGKRFAVALVRDITQRKAAERALIESHSLLKAVVEGTSGAVFVKDLNGRYRDDQLGWSALFGLTVDEVSAGAITTSFRRTWPTRSYSTTARCSRRATRIRSKRRGRCVASPGPTSRPVVCIAMARIR